MRLFLPLFGILAASLIASGAASAQSQTALPDRNSTGRAIVLHPLSLVKVEDLDFGWVTVTAAGTATLNPATGAVTTTGGVLPAGGAPHAALFVGAGSRNTPVKIRIPNKPITMTRTDGPETISLSAWTLDGPADRRIGASRAFEFRVGGTITLAAGQVEGLYVGTFNVEVQYP